MRPNSPVYRKLRNLLIIMVIIVVAIVAFSVHRATLKRTVVNRVLGPPGLQFPSFAAPLGGLGCYHKQPADQVWQSVACVPPSETRKLPRPQADATMLAASNGNGVPATSRATSLWEGYVDVVFFNKFSGEVDPGFGGISNSWSIQANTNFFTGNNGDTDWVQFVYQNVPPPPPGSSFAPSPPNLCVDQEDMNLGNSQNAVQQQCVDTTVQTLSSNFAGYVTAITTPSQLCKEVPYFYWRYDCVPANYLTAIFTSWNGGEVVGESWAVTALDVFGLSTRWSRISGTIVGTALGSEAQFTSPTLIISNIGAYGPALKSASFTNLNLPGSTAETNNLSFISESTYCVSGGWCYLVTEMGN